MNFKDFIEVFENKFVPLGAESNEFVSDFIYHVHDQVNNQNFENQLRDLIREFENPAMALKVKEERERKIKEAEERYDGKDGDDKK